jgi:ATP-binding cassette subfamily B protein
LTAHEEEAFGKAYDARLMRRLLRYLQPYRGRVIIAILVLLTAAGIEVVGGLITRHAIDVAIPQRDTTLLIQLGAAYLAAMILGYLLESNQIVLTRKLGQGVMFDLRRELFQHLQKLGLRFYDKNPVGRLITRVTNDVEVLNELFSSGLITVFGDVFTLLVIATVMLIVDWRLALVTFAVMPFVFMAAGMFRSRIRDAYRDIRTRLARINAYLQERISGVSIVQLFGRERDTQTRFREITADYLQAHLRSVTYYALFFPVIEILTSISVATAILYGGNRVLSEATTLGTLTAFLLWARRFFQPIQDLSEKYNMLQDAMASSERIFGLLDEPAPQNTGSHQFATAEGRVEFRDVWFAYQERSEGAWDWVLRNVSFKADPGERVAIVGHTGAGKTTIIGLLMRFYEPQRGQILFDGVDIREIEVHELRSRIALVLQDVFIFSESVEFNIRLGRSDISHERVRQAAARVGAERFIQRLPDQYGAALGERGLTLSVGERQLLSFARALAYDPLVLVLDEATSSVDSALEEQIEHAVETLMQGRTSIVIAHRLSTIQNATRILVLHHGEVVELGTHSELLELGGLYSRLHELQFATGGSADPSTN